MAVAPQSRSEIIDNLFVTTWRNRKTTVIDQVYQITPFYSMLLEKGRIRVEETGGRFFDIPIRHARANSNVKFFDKGDTFAQSDDEFLTELTYQMRYLGDNIVRFWQDDLVNRGEMAMLNYVNQKIDAHKAELVDTMEVSSFVADPSGKGFNSLGELVANDPTAGTVAQYARSDNDWIQNQTLDVTGQTVSSTLLPNMTNLFNTCSKYKAGTRRAPDFILTNQDNYEDFETIARNLQQIVANTSIQASLGFGDLSFKGVPVFWAPECPANTMYMLNLEHFHFVTDSNAWFDMTEWKPRSNTSDREAQILTAGNLMVDNFKKQGVMFNIDN